MILISTHAGKDYAELIAASPAIGFLSKTALSADAIRELLAGHGDGDRGDLVGRPREGDLVEVEAAIRVVLMPPASTSTTTRSIVTAANGDLLDVLVVGPGRPA